MNPLVISKPLALYYLLEHPKLKRYLSSDEEEILKHRAFQVSQFELTKHTGNLAIF